MTETLGTGARPPDVFRPSLTRPYANAALSILNRRTQSRNSARDVVVVVVVVNVVVVTETEIVAVTVAAAASASVLNDR